MVPCRHTALRCRSLLALLSLLHPAHAQGADPAALRIELNRLEPRESGACRVWLVAGNQAGEPLDALRLDLVLFGRDGIILRRIAVELGPLPAARTTVRIFDVGGQACDGIGAMLMNDVLACGGAGPQRDTCADRITLRSRAAGVEFHK